ncbi:MAG: ABC transporter permease [Treponema sp.]
MKEKTASLLNSIISVIASAGAAAVCLVLQSEEPLESLTAFFASPFTDFFYFGNMLDRAGLILLCALGFIIPSKAGFFNLGGEGQAYLAALIAVEFALFFPQLPQPAGLVTGCLIAVLCAGVLGCASALLKQFLGITELISTYLMSCALLPLIDYGINEVFRDAAGNLMATPYTAESWYLPQFWVPSTLNGSIFAAAAAALAVFWMLKRTRYGYELRLTGDNPSFAQSQGINSAAVSIMALTLGAACHGLAGAFSVYGSRHYVYSGITGGLGWSGISAALIGRTHPIGAVFGALFFAWIEAGGKAALIHSSVSFDLSAVVQGVAFFLITVDFFRNKGRC